MSVLDASLAKVKNSESGTLTAQLDASEVGSIYLDPVPQYAPGVIVMKAGEAEEEHIFFRKRDAVGGTVSGLTRDITSLNGGTGRLHINTTPWESMQAAEYVNFLVEVLQRGWQNEMQASLYVSTTSFTVEGNQAARYTAGRIVRYAESDSKIGVVVSSSYSGGTGLTTVTVKGYAVPNPIVSVEFLNAQAKGFTGDSPVFYGEDAGANDTYTITVIPTIGAYFKGMIVVFQANTANTGAATLNVNGLGAIPIKKLHDQALITGDIEAAQYVVLVYDGTNFQMQSGVPETNKPMIVGIMVVDPASDVATGDGKAYFRIPLELNGMNLTRVAATSYTAGTTGTEDIQIRNKTQAADMLTTKITIDSGETDTSTAATPAVIDTGNDDVATGDVIAIDVDAVQTTEAKGLYVELIFELP